MDPELEILETSFNTRIEKWISKQGLLFQFTHSTGSASILPKICGTLIRLLIISIIGLVVFWFYLSNRPNSKAFKEDVQIQLATGLNAKEVEIANITKGKSGLLTGEILLSLLALGETKSSFFEDWYVKEEEVSVVGRQSVVETKKMATLEGVKLSPFHIVDNYLSGWSGNVLEILRMKLKLKVGGETDEQAMVAYSSLFKQYETLNIDTIQIFDATLFWGYSESSSGSIKGAQLDIVKGVDSWEINVKGGTFSHYWLKNAAINEMNVICKRSGEVIIESASLGLGNGELKLKASIQIQAQPELVGEYSFEDVEVTNLIGGSYEKWLDGSINGKGELAGKLNSKEGIKVSTTVNLTGRAKRLRTEQFSSEPADEKQDSVLIIRGDNLEFFKLLQLKDSLNSYSRLRAYDGTLMIVSQGKDTQVTLKNIRCGLNDLMLVNGKFSYALETQHSKKEEIDISRLELKENEINISRKSLETNVSEQDSGRIRAFSGGIELGLIPQVFEGNVKILEVYPIDKATLRMWFNIELNGQLEGLTEEFANNLYEIMKEGENN